jgi:hypothetical protein
MGCGTSAMSEHRYRQKVERKHREAEEEAKRKRREADNLFRTMDDLLSANNLFDALSREDRRELVDAMERVDVLRGERILRKKPKWVGLSLPRLHAP